MMPTSSSMYPGTELDALACARNYYRWILSNFLPYLGDRVIEVGAGMGTFSQFLLKAGGGLSELVLVEPADNLFPILARRFAGDPRVRVVHGFLEDLANSCRGAGDCIVLVNVLEHIEDDQRFLEAAFKLLRPQGRLLLLVPACPGLYGTLDRVFGHARRYTKPDLRGRLRATGFEVVRLRYFNFPGVAAWFLAGRVLRQRTLPPAMVKLYDRLVVPWASRLERGNPPVGQSLVGIAIKPVPEEVARDGRG